MKLSNSILQSIDASILCWLATCDAQGMPNVSPKEIFCAYETDSILIANIASPQSMRNIKANPKVCLSILDILVQKGFQLKGIATIVDKSNEGYDAMNKLLEQMTGGLFPFNTIFKIKIEQSKPIVSPRYWLYPETTEADQIADAKKQYGFDE